ncbi:ABC transporter substrate-binding protein [Martelella mangrovi]|uniref:Peptide/nickel transport system substrate-binding protein n=1 Tax=Martelella mangrovi TaxID=1397477 RepID=A0ABV2IDI9_9HYPH
MFDISRRTFLSSVAAAALVAPLGLHAETIEPVKGGTLNIAVDQAVSVINPLQVRVNPEYLVAEMLYSALTKLRRDMSVAPDLAESWTANDDLTEWTFKLRSGIVFHDGTPCTSEDVVATFQAILNADNASPGRKNVGPIDTIEAVDDLSVLFRLSTAYADFPVAVAYTNAKIIPAAIAGGDINVLASKAVGTGPFTLVSYEPDREIVVAKNPDYYDPERPYVDEVVVSVYPDTSAESSAMIAGDVDIITPVNPGEYLRMDGSDGVDMLRVASGQFCNVNFGCDTPPFNDPRVRKALALTVDRNAMLDFVTEGFGTLGDDTPISPAYRFYKDLPQREQNIAEAKKLLAEAGMPDGFEATLVASENPPVRTQMAVALREMAKDAGIKINVQTMPHATYLDQVWKKGNFYIGFYNMQPTADGIFKLLYTSDASWNETRWNNTEFDALVDEARATADEAKRTELYGKAQELMNEDVPSIIPAFMDILGAKRSWVNGYDVHPRAAVFMIDEVWLAEDAPRRG